MKTLSARTAGFTDSVIRRMTRISLQYGAVNLSVALLGGAGQGIHLHGWLLGQSYAPCHHGTASQPRDGLFLSQLHDGFVAFLRHLLFAYLYRFSPQGIAQQEEQVVAWCHSCSIIW